jgi:DNA polymerase-3 subunit delta
MNVDPHTPVVLLKGSDEVILGDAVSTLVRAMVGSGDRTLMVAEVGIDDHATDDGHSIGPLVDAAQTPPFLTDRRVVVARHAGVFSTKDAVAPLVAYLEDPLPSTSLVIVWEKDPRPGRQARGAAVPKSLADAIAGAGGVVVDTSPATGRAQAGWIDERLVECPVKFDAAARRALVDHVGEDVGLLPQLLTLLEGVFGSDTKVGVADIEPYLGTAGDVAPWDLTDAIDAGDTVRALSVLERMMAGGGRHPIQILATLQNHYLRMVRLDDPEIRGEKAAAEALGLKGSTFPAKKALDGLKRLGPERLDQIVGLLAQADLDLRGTKAWAPELVIEVLVARLAGRSRTTARGRR